MLDSPLVQPLSRSSLVFLLVLGPQLHTPYISSSHLIAAHAYTNAVCSAAIPVLCHLYLVSQLLTCLLATGGFKGEGQGGHGPLPQDARGDI